MEALKYVPLYRLSIFLRFGRVIECSYSTSQEVEDVFNGLYSAISNPENAENVIMGNSINEQGYKVSSYLVRICDIISVDWAKVN